MSSKENVIVLGVYIHCQGCAETVVKCLRGYDGVEGIEVDSKNQKVIVKGEKADPIKVAERLRKKSGKYVKLISPIPKNDKKEEKKDEKKEPKVVEVVLKVYLHCEGCAKDVKHCIHKMPGVQTVQPDIEKNLVIVKGAIEPEKLVEFVKKRAGKHAEIVKPEKKKQNDDENKGKESEKNCNKKDLYDNFCPELFYAPQLFSDENPNSCSIM
ncbi:hypothetical protein ACH5RR_030867 [Cinchona calisaya]|uniref:HMA domain-containing protein n=1 Tax=Cinchona calisaya TaxID=153742 RepID=A0ABD2YY07_9GENT